MAGFLPRLDSTRAEAHDVESYVANGTLISVLQDWCEPYPGFFLYYPSRRQQTAALLAVIDVLRM